MESGTAPRTQSCGTVDNSTQISVDTLGEFRRVTLTNGAIQIAVLPEIGGKMISLRRLESGREFLLQPPERPYRRACYGALFEDYDASGFDECLPTIAACEYPDEGKFAGMSLPDHGELWSAAWEHEVGEGELLLQATGRRLPYVFRKKVRIEEATVVIRYELENTSNEPFRFVWSAHPLLGVESGCRILLPSDVSRLLINSSHRNRLGSAGDYCRWPIHLSPGGPVDLSVLGARSDRAADKLFTNSLAQGWCALHYPASDESICFRFDAELVPHLGVWICQGGWPSEDAGHFTVALEPCMSSFDSLAEAVSNQQCGPVAAGSVKNWELRIELKAGTPVEITSRP